MSTSRTISKDAGVGRGALEAAFRNVRRTTVALCEPLEPEDMVVQTMPDVSPTKWHLAHTTWFFETFVLEREAHGYEAYDARFKALFNSYYQRVGSPYPRHERGLLSRPTVREVLAYREHVDAALLEWLRTADGASFARAEHTLTVGLHHEQQHQELLLMDLKHVLAHNPLRPAYIERPVVRSAPAPALEWVPFEGGLVEIGHSGPGFTFDNERPRHRALVVPFELASRPVSVGEYRAFIEDGGYERSDLWLAEGWERVEREPWRAPQYWHASRGEWKLMTLAGLRPLDPSEPVCHVSYYEADAYSRWAGARLPSEAEWEHAAAGRPLEGTFLKSHSFHPRPMDADSGGDGSSRSLHALFGDVWEWTSSPYAPYPGFEPFRGDLGEYNGKFMINQIVLRGGCCVTPRDHIRDTYRNFFYPHQRWQFAGIRLARDLSGA